MNITLTGEIRGIDSGKDKNGKEYFVFQVEQVTKKLPIQTRVFSSKNGRKVGEKVSLFCSVTPRESKGRAYLNVWEQDGPGGK